MNPQHEFAPATAVGAHLKRGQCVPASMVDECVPPSHVAAVGMIDDSIWDPTAIVFGDSDVLVQEKDRGQDRSACWDTSLPVFAINVPNINRYRFSR